MDLVCIVKMGNSLMRLFDDVNHRDESGRTALHIAALHGDQERCRDLVTRGAHLEIRDKWGNTLPFNLVYL